MELSKLIKKQDEEFDDFFWEREKYEGRELGIDGYLEFISKVRKETAEYVLNILLEEIKQQSKDLRNSMVDSGKYSQWNSALKQSADKLDALYNNILKELKGGE